MKRRVAVVGSIAAITAVVAGTTPAMAQPLTKNGRCGAGNMTNPHSIDQMRKAMMEHTDDHGDAGMLAAVARTSCGT